MPATDARDGKVQAPGQWTLLMVDDDADLLEALADLVEHGLPGVQVVQATSGREALERLQGMHVDGILSDLGMEGMDGLQFLRIARQCHPGIPRIMLTAHADPALGRQAEAEADLRGFMTKLIEPEDLLERVGDLLGYKPVGRPAA